MSLSAVCFAAMTHASCMLHRPHHHEPHLVRSPSPSQFPLASPSAGGGGGGSSAGGVTRGGGLGFAMPPPTPSSAASISAPLAPASGSGVGSGGSASDTGRPPPSGGSTFSSGGSPSPSASGHSRSLSAFPPVPPTPGSAAGASSGWAGGAGDGDVTAGAGGIGFNRRSTSAGSGSGSGPAVPALPLPSPATLQHSASSYSFASAHSGSGSGGGASGGRPQLSHMASFSPTGLLTSPSGSFMVRRDGSVAGGSVSSPPTGTGDVLLARKTALAAIDRSKTASKPSNVVVGVRSRPLNELEQNMGDEDAWVYEPDAGVLYEKSVLTGGSIAGGPNGMVTREHTYDFVYPPDTHTVQVYDSVCQPIVAAAMEGYNGTLFAYGQTGEGARRGGGVGRGRGGRSSCCDLARGHPVCRHSATFPFPPTRGRQRQDVHADGYGGGAGDDDFGGA